MSTTATRPANSQLNTAILPSGVKSPWSSPWQSGNCTRSTSCQVTGSYQIRLRSSSATEIAYLPSGVKYMLYGSATGIVSPGCPVIGSMRRITLPTSSVAYSAVMSCDGTTCCTSVPTGNLSTTWKVR